MISLTALARIPVPQWDALAHLQRSGGKANAAIMRSILAVQSADLETLVDQGLIACFRGSTDTSVDLRTWSFLPMIEVRLTTAGRATATRIVTMAGILLLLSRRGRTGVSVPKLLEAASVPLDVVRELHALRMADVVPADGSHELVDITRVGERSSDIHVRITPTGKRYTTEAQR